jgi:hypothetical protein
MKSLLCASLILFPSSVIYSCIDKSEADSQDFHENAKKYLPDVPALALLMESLEQRIQDYTPELAMYRHFRSSGRSYYHTAVRNAWVHGLRANASFATDLLDTGDSTYQALGFRVWKAVISYQDQDTASRSIMKRDVKPGYTNIAIMGTLVTHLAGRLFEIPELKDYSDMRLERFYNYTIDLQGFQEYNSPTYTVVSLDELQRMKQYLLDPATLEMVDYCYRLAWEELAVHFHVPSAQLGGPHSRNYSTLLRKRFYDLLYSASNGQIHYGEAGKRIAHYKLRHQIPDDLIPSFTDPGEERTRIYTFSKDKYPVIGTTWLHPMVCFGSANRSTTWQQRRPWLIYWGDDKIPKYLWVKLLHDFVDFGVGNIFTVQDRCKALTGLNFATDGGDYHLPLDRIIEGRFSASDLRLRFEAGPASLFDSLHKQDDQFTMHAYPVKIQVEMLHARFGDYRIKIEKGLDEDHCWMDWIIYHGQEKDIDLTQLGTAAFAWATCISADPDDPASCPPARSEISGSNLRMETDGIFLSIPVVPAREIELQHGMVHPLQQ